MRKRRGLSLLCFIVIFVSRCDVILTLHVHCLLFLGFHLASQSILNPWQDLLLDLLRLRHLRHLRGVIDQPSFSCD